MNGYNFTQRVRQALASAREEAARLHHAYVGTEHELLGILRGDDGAALTMLRSLNVPIDQLRSRIESSVMLGTSGPTGPDLPYTSRAKKVLELAMSEARDANHAYVGTEHLLLGLLVEERGIAAQTLTSFGITPAALRAQLSLVNGMDADDRSATLVGSATGEAGRWAWFALAAGRIEQVVAEARRIAASRGAQQLEGAHVALGLIAHGEGTALAALARMGCDLPRLASDLEALLPSSSTGASPEVIPVSHDFARVIAAAQTEQQAWAARVVGTHHLLLALLEICPDVARVFTAQGVTPGRLRSEARRAMG